MTEGRDATGKQAIHIQGPKLKGFRKITLIAKDTYDFLKGFPKRNSSKYA